MPPASLDLVVLFYHFDRSLFAKIVAGLKAGGLIVCKMAVRWESPEPTLRSDPALRRDELVKLFPEIDVLHYEERPVRQRGVAELVGRKPLDP